MPNIKGIMLGVSMHAKPITEACMMCQFMPKYAKAGDICVKYKPAMLPIMDFNETMEAFGDGL